MCSGARARNLLGVHRLKLGPLCALPLSSEPAICGLTGWINLHNFIVAVTDRPSTGQVPNKFALFQLHSVSPSRCFLAIERTIDTLDAWQKDSRHANQAPSHSYCSSRSKICIVLQTGKLRLTGPVELEGVQFPTRPCVLGISIRCRRQLPLPSLILNDA